MQEEYQNIENGISLIDLINILLRNIFIIIAIIAAFTIAGIIYTYKFVEPTYEASSDVWIHIDTTSNEEGDDPTDYDFNTTLRIIQSIAELFEKDVIVKETILELDLDVSPNDFTKNLNVNYDTNSFFITIGYECNDPELAGVIVNATIENTINFANNNLASIRNTITQIGQAEDGRYVSPNKPLNIIISFILGAIVGVAVVLLIEALKTTVRNKKELELFLPNYKVIGVIPIIEDKEN